MMSCRLYDRTQGRRNQTNLKIAFNALYIHLFFKWMYFLVFFDDRTNVFRDKRWKEGEASNANCDPTLFLVT